MSCHVMSTALLSSLSVSVTSLHINIPPDPSALRIACSGVFDGSYTPEQVAAFDLVTRVFLLPHYIAHSPLAFTLQSLAFAGTFTYSFCLDMGPIDWEISTIRLPTTDEYQNICRSGMYSEPQQQHIQMLFEPILRYCRSLTSLDADHLVFHHGSLSGADIPEYDIYPALATLRHLKAPNVYDTKLYLTNLQHIDFSHDRTPHQRNEYGNIYTTYTSLRCLYPSGSTMRREWNRDEEKNLEDFYENQNPC